MVVIWTIIILSARERRERSEDRETEAPIVTVATAEDGFLRFEELRQLLECTPHQGKVLVGLVMHSEDVAEHQTRIIPDEVGVPEENRLHHLGQLIFDVLGV